MFMSITVFFIYTIYLHHVPDIIILCIECTERIQFDSIYCIPLITIQISNLFLKKLHFLSQHKRDQPNLT